MTKISARDLCAGCGLLVSIRTIQRHKHRILAGFTCGDRKGRKAALHYLPKLAGGVKDVREVNGWEHVARNGNNAEYAQAGRSSDEATVGEVVHPNEFEGDGEAQMLNHNNEDAYASGNCDGIRRAPCGNAGGDSNIHEDAHMHADSSNDIDIDIDAHANDDGNGDDHNLNVNADSDGDGDATADDGGNTTADSSDGYVTADCSNGNGDATADGNGDGDSTAGSSDGNSYASVDGDGDGDGNGDATADSIDRDSDGDASADGSDGGARADDGDGDASLDGSDGSVCAYDSDSDATTDGDDQREGSDRGDTSAYEDGSDKADNIICEGSRISRSVALELLLRWKVIHNIGNNAFAELCALLHHHLLPDGNSFPGTFYLFKQAIRDSTSTRIKAVDYHVCCCGGHCFPRLSRHLWSDHADDVCPKCRAPRFKRMPSGEIRLSDARRFKYIALIPQLCLLMRSQAFVSAVTSYFAVRQARYQERHEGTPGTFYDVFDGQLWCDLAQRFPDVCNDPYCLVLDVGFDFAQPYRSNVAASVGPIVVRILSLPPHLRAKSMYHLLVGIVPFGSQPPAIHGYFECLINELQQLFDGSTHVPCAAEEKGIPLRAVLLISVNDRKAFEKVSGIQSVAGFVSCGRCLFKGERLEQPRRAADGAQKKLYSGTFFRGYLSGAAYSATQRSNESFRLQAEQAAWGLVTQQDTGIAFVSPLAKLEYFDVVSGFPIEVFHNLVRGLVYAFWNRCFGKLEWGDQGYDFILSNNARREITRRLSTIVVPHDFGRKPRDVVRYLGSLKGEELLNWTVVFSPFVMEGLWPTEWLRVAWMCLREAVCIHLREAAVTEAQLCFADRCMQQYAALVERFMPPDSVLTMNLHSAAVHLFGQVQQTGPCSATAGWWLERAIGSLLRLVLGRTTSSPELSIVDAYVFQTERRMLRDAGILPPLPAIFPSKGRDGDTPKAGDIILLGRSRRVTLVGRFITNPAALRGRQRRELQPENLGSFYFVVKALAENFSFDPTATNCEQVQRTADCFFCNATVCGFYG
eukprot:Opistho-2@35137